MIALSIALGVVGVLAVIAAWHVALRWLAGRVPDVAQLRENIDAVRELAQSASEAAHGALASAEGSVEAAKAAATQAKEAAAEARAIRLGKGLRA